MTAKKHTITVLLALLALSLAVAQASGKKKTPDGALVTRDNSRATAMASSRKASDPFGFMKGSDQHKKNKDCGCPGTKKGERQRKKEYRSHRKRK